jgi:hypothetical protein
MHQCFRDACWFRFIRLYFRRWRFFRN